MKKRKNKPGALENKKEEAKDNTADTHINTGTEERRIHS